MTDYKTSSKTPGRKNKLVVLGFISLAVVLAFLPEGCRRSKDVPAEVKNVVAIETTEQFQAKVLGEDGLKVVDFYAVWCQPCKILAPILEDLAGEYKGKVPFYKLDAEQLRDLSARYEIRAYPTVLLFDSTGPVHRWVGLGKRAMYKETIEQYIAGKGKKQTQAEK